MHAKCGALGKAQLLGKEKNHVSGRYGHQEAIAYVASLKGCAKRKELENGIKLHYDVIEKGLLEKNLYIGSALVNMYAKCGALKRAQKVLDELHVRNVTCWNALIGGYAQQGRCENALNCFEQMQRDGISPNTITFTYIMKACGITQEVNKGSLIHEEIFRNGLLEKDILLGTAVVDMYAKCGKLEKAQKVLDGLPLRDVFTWNALIAGYAHQSQSEAALNCFEQMKHDGLCPDVITFTCILKACSSTAAIDKGIQIHREIVNKGFLVKDTILGTALVDMYAKCSELRKAHQVLDELLVRDVVTWNTLIAGYTQHGQSENALNCFEQMKNDGISPNTTTIACILEACGNIGALDKAEQIHHAFFKKGTLEKDIVLGTALVDMYAKCGKLVKAQQIHNSLHVRDAISWNALIAGYAHQGHGEEALKGFHRMQNEGFSPNVVTFICILVACGNIGAINKGVQIHNEIVNKAILRRKETVLSTALVDMYVKCGELRKAQQVFDELLIRDVPSWNALIRGYAEQGQGEEALKCFSRMQDQHVFPDVVTFLCVLNACCHSSLVHEGQIYFENMSEKYGLAPEIEHYTCMVELFGRAGDFDKAMEVIRKMPSCDYPVWLSLLSSCEKWGNVRVGRLAFDEAIQLDHANGSAYACMINLYLTASMFEEANKIEAMKVKIIDL